MLDQQLPILTLNEHFILTLYFPHQGAIRNVMDGITIFYVCKPYCLKIFQIFNFLHNWVIGIADLDSMSTKVEQPVNHSLCSVQWRALSGISRVHFEEIKFIYIHILRAGKAYRVLSKSNQQAALAVTSPERVNTQLYVTY